MTVFRKALPRRTVLKGAGAAIALPLLESMVPAFSALAQTPAASTRRLALVYVGNGVAPGYWTPAQTGAIVECLQRQGQRYQFNPYWTLQTLFQADGTPDLCPENVRLVMAGERVLGCLAAWDQSRFKQTIVQGYTTPLRQWRRLINVGAKVVGWPPLPDVHAPIRHCFASHLAVEADDPALFAALLRAVYNDAVERGFSYLMLGLADTHPFRPLVESYRHILYPSQLYLVAWEDGWEAVAGIDPRPPGIEAAVL